MSSNLALSNTSSSQSEELCLVCNDISTGYHYGTPSCNGCKTFFRRTIIKKQIFVCQYDGKCLIDKSVRCACRHCRFEKCLAVGMSREAIQQNRDPIGYTKRTRRYPTIKGALSDKLNGTAGIKNSSSTPFWSINGGQGSPQSVAEITPVQVTEDLIMEKLMRIESHVSTVRNSQTFVQKSFLDIVLQPSIFYDDEYLKKQAESPHSSHVLQRATQKDFNYWHERDWVIMIEWAKTIPAYDVLSLSDKLALLRHSAITYPSLNQCFYSADMGPDTLVFPNGTFFDRKLERDRPASFQRKKFKMLDNLLKPIRKLDIDINEFGATKAIFFLNPDADDLSPDVRSQIADARSAITHTLYRYMVRKRGSEDSVDRFGKILLLGTVISTIAVEAKEAVVVANFFEQVQFSQLAKQLLFGMKDDTTELQDPKSMTSSELASGNVIRNSTDSIPMLLKLDGASINSLQVPPLSLTPSASVIPSTSYNFDASSHFSQNIVSKSLSNETNSNYMPSAAANNFLTSAFTSYMPNAMLNSTKQPTGHIINPTDNSSTAAAAAMSSILKSTNTAAAAAVANNIDTIFNSSTTLPT